MSSFRPLELPLSSQPLQRPAPDNNAAATTSTGGGGGGGDPPPQQRPAKPVACAECHSAKVKCDKAFPCSRCVRLGRKCYPHVSKQGRGRKRRRGGTDGATTGTGGRSDKNKDDENGQSQQRQLLQKQNEPPQSNESVIAGAMDEEVTGKAQKGGGVAMFGAAAAGGTHDDSDGAKAKAAGLLEDALDAGHTTFRPDHFGLRHMIRSWISFAIRRRSFTLLAKAGSLAARVGITMDSILCGDSEMATGGGNRGIGCGSPLMTASHPGAAGGGLGLGLGLGAGLEAGFGAAGPMNFLVPALLVPSRHQHLGSSSHLRWSELPPDLLTSTGCVPIDAGLEAQFLPSILGNRWIMIRELNEGMSRYFASPAFDRDVATWSLIQSTWAANEREVISLFLAPEGKRPHTKGLMHQFARYITQGVALRPCRYATKILVKENAITNGGISGGITGGMPSSGIPIDVECVMCMKIVNIDRAYLYTEYVRNEVVPPPAVPAVLASLSSSAATAAAVTATAAQAQMMQGPPPPTTTATAQPFPFPFVVPSGGITPGAGAGVGAGAGGLQQQASSTSSLPRAGEDTAQQNTFATLLNLDTATDLGEMEELFDLLRQGP